MGNAGITPMKLCATPWLVVWGLARLRLAIGPLALAAALALGAAGAKAQSPEQSAPSAERGKVGFVRHGCWQCHGYEGQGGVTGLKLAPDPIPFETLSNFVRTSNRTMPPYREEILSNEDLADIYAYLKSIPKGPDPASIPLLGQ